MKHWVVSRICLLALVGAATFAVAESPFIGTWKMDPAKSHMTGATMKFSPASNGLIRETVAEGSYTFKPDGSSYPSLFGETENWSKLSGHSWKVITHGNGGFTYTGTLTVSDDGQSLTTTEEGSNPDGTGFHDSTVYTRLSGSKGLMGTWKSTRVKTTADRTLEFSANGEDGIIWHLPQIKATLAAKFDGKDYTPVGPTVPKGLTLALTKNGDDSFKMIEKINGRAIFMGKYTVSADGKTLTEVGAPAGQTQPETVVYDKQS